MMKKINIFLSKFFVPIILTIMASLVAYKIATFLTNR